MSLYSFNRKDGVMDTARDRIWLPRYMTILTANEIYFILICFLPLWIFFGWAEFFMVTRFVITYSIINILLFINWRSSFKEYHI